MEYKKAKSQPETTSKTYNVSNITYFKNQTRKWYRQYKWARENGVGSVKQTVLDYSKGAYSSYKALGGKLTFAEVVGEGKKKK